MDYLYENGKILNEGDFVEGEEHGYWQQYWDNGKLKMKRISTWENCTDPKSYSQKGKLTLTGEYEDDLKTGLWTRYDEKGNLLETGFYKVIEVKKQHINYGPLANHTVKESVKDGLWVFFSPKDHKRTMKGITKKEKKTVRGHIISPVETNPFR
ncbi:MAG: hypothetical protein IPM74_19475 [Crocinitomicaceae bacterium]|nr:hypothetical protein [Crocinitomicaceae bacterium]